MIIFYLNANLKLSIFLRFEAVNAEYDEDLTLGVLSYVDRDKKKILYTTEIKGKKQFNSSFFLKFGEGIGLVKGTSCSIRAMLPHGWKADYQNITKGQISSGKNNKETANTHTYCLENYVLEGENWDEIQPKCADVDSTFGIFKSLLITYI